MFNVGRKLADDMCLTTFRLRNCQNETSNSSTMLWNAKDMDVACSGTNKRHGCIETMEGFVFIDNEL